jgi:hypothetical protein
LIHSGGSKGTGLRDNGIGRNAIQTAYQGPSGNEELMDKWQTTWHVEKIRREIAEIQAADRIYKTKITHTVAQIADHEKRQRRLQEIMGELKIMSGHSDG